MSAAADFADGAGLRAESPGARTPAEGPRSDAAIARSQAASSGAQAPVNSDTRHASLPGAAERLDASRLKLHAALFPPPPPPRAPPAPGAAPPWRDRIKSIPAVTMLLDSLQGWWSHHPMRPVAQVAREASNAAVRPMAQTHPLVLVFSAALAGAAIGWIKPWRWLFGSAIFAGLVPRIASKMLLRMPIESWMGVAGAALRGGSRRPDPKAPSRPHSPTEAAPPQRPL